MKHLSLTHSHVHAHSHAPLHSTRLLSLSKSSLADSQFVAGIHPEADPEQSAGILSVLTGEKNLPERWAVRVVHNFFNVFLRTTFANVLVAVHIILFTFGSNKACTMALRCISLCANSL